MYTSIVIILKKINVDHFLHECGVWANIIINEWPLLSTHIQLSFRSMLKGKKSDGEKYKVYKMLKCFQDGVK